MKICMVGSGYVGLVAAACFAELGHEVICVDNDSSKISALNKGVPTIHERFLPELLKRHHGTLLRFSGSLPDSIRSSQAIFIAVGTPPSESGEADLSYVEGVSREIASVIASHPHEYRIVVEKSTVPVDTSQAVRRVMELHGAPRFAFDVASNPEFLREGTAVTDFLYPDRIVAGAESVRCIALLREIYEPLTSGSYYRSATAIPGPDGTRVPPPLIATSTQSAELIKHASNAFLATKISFINAVAAVCEAVGGDIEQVRIGMGADARIGSRFLNAGIGYGGSCFPKDVKAFRAVARHCGYDFSLLEEVMKINDSQPHRFVNKVRKALWILKGKRLAVLGLAFKGGTDDVRDSQAVAIIQLLLQQGCTIAVYDPAAVDKARSSHLFSEDKISFADSAYAAAANADAVLVLTDWEEFAALDLERLRSALRHPIMIDGRNLFRPDKMAEVGFTYISVGRPEVTPAKSEVPQVPDKAVRR